MCGILGELSNKKITEAVVFKQLLDMSHRRGPDAQRIWSDTHVQFGFNRLSILDTSDKGMQPIISPSGRYIVILNGEIYNYKKLQAHYSIEEHTLRSGSDVEIVAHLADVVDKKELPALLNGMFALALYDKAEQELLIARDFAGIKPLFYGIGEGIFVFASQFDQIFSHPQIKPSLKVSAQGIRDYLELGYMQAPNTVFGNIFQLRPGEAIIISSEMQRQVFRFKEYPAVNKEYRYKETDPGTIKVFEDVFRNVISDQLVSDVSIGTFLSGGIDSPLVTALAKENNKDITAFTFGVNDPELNELEQAQLYSKHLNVQLLSDTLEADSIIEMCDEHFKAYPEPFGDASSLPTYIITKLSRQHLTVMLSGDGGDELFWGYPRFLGIIRDVGYFRYPRKMRKLVSGMQRRIGKKISYGVSEFERVGEWQLNKHAHLTLPFTSRIFKNVKRNEEVDYLYQYSSSVDNKTDLLDWLRWNEFYAHMQRVLIKVDRASMYNSLEVRVPFLDERILDLSWQIRPGLGIEHTNLKLILKKAMEDFYPKEIIYKEKKGFSIPYASYLRNELKEDVQKVIFEKELFGSEYYNAGELKDYVQHFLSSGKGSAWGVWIVYALQKWASNYGFA